MTAAFTNTAPDNDVDGPSAHTWVVSGFYTQNYTMSLINGTEIDQGVGQPHFAIRCKTLAHLRWLRLTCLSQAVCGHDDTNGDVPEWPRIRFRPTVVGQHRATVTIAGKGIAKPVSYVCSFTVTDAISSWAGYIRVADNQQHFVEDSTGKTWFAVGENLGWTRQGKLDFCLLWLATTNPSAPRTPGLSMANPILSRCARCGHRRRHRSVINVFNAYSHWPN